MTLPTLRSLASYHDGQALRLRQAAEVVHAPAAEDLRVQALWHSDIAQQVSDLADTFQSVGKLLTNVTGDSP